MELHNTWEKGQEANPGSMMGKQFTPTQRKLYDEGRSYFDDGNYDMAITNWKELVRLKPDLSAMYYNLGLAYYRKGLLNEAENNFKKAIELYPANADARVNLGVVFRQMIEKLAGR